MALDLDSYFGVHAKALGIREQRATQLTLNLANVNTPNYKAKDIDFNAALSQAMSQDSSIQGSNPGHLPATGNFNTDLKFRQTNHRTLDGNTVDRDLETKEFAKNALGYQSSLSFLTNKIKTMMSAWRGE